MTNQTHRYIIALIILVAALALIASSSLWQGPETPVSKGTPETSEGSTTIPMTVVTFKQNATSSPSISYEYPQFPSLLVDFNAAIASATLSRLAEFKSESADNEAARNATSIAAEASIPPNAFTFISSWQQAQINSKYVSIIVRYDSYTGGANGNQDLQTFNYDVTNGRVVTLQDLFGNKPDYLKYLSDTSREQLRSSQRDASPGYVPGQMLLDGTAPTLENFSNFTFTDNAVTFYFPKYAVAPGAFGEQRVMISR